MKNIAIEYTAQGEVFGLTWDFAKGTYPAKKYRSRDKEELIAEIKRDFESGTLDSGFGFKDLLGYRMGLTTTKAGDYEGETWITVKTEIIEEGEMPPIFDEDNE